MRILLLGAGGQVGRALMACKPSDVTISAYARADLNIADAARLEAVVHEETPDVIVNAAGYTGVDDAESNPELAEIANAVAPGAIAAAARRVGARMVHLSTDFVFDGLKSSPYQPDDQPAPLSVYGATKWRGEQAVAAADPGALIVRTAWVYDSGPSNFVGTIRRLAGERNRLTIVDDQVGTPTSARSLATALWQMIGKGAQGIYHYTDCGVASWYDFAVAIVEEGNALGLLDRQVAIDPISTREFPAAAARPPYSVLDKSATWAELGVKAGHWRVNLQSVLKEISRIG